MSIARASLLAVLVALACSSRAAALGDCPSSAAIHVVAPGWPGSAGFPQLTVAGEPVVGGPHVEVHVAGAPAHATGVLLLATEFDPLTLTYGQPVALANPLLVVHVQADATGGMTLSPPAFTLIDPIFCGQDAYVQVAIQDAGAIGGWSLTPCVRLHFGGPPAPLVQIYPMPSWPVAHNACDVILADVTGDGLSDIVAADVQMYGLAAACATRVALGGGAYEPRIALELPDASPRELAAGDLDADGDADLVTAHHGSGYPQPDYVLALLSNGDGSLQAGDTELTGFGAYEPVLGDLDGDGALDVVVMNRSDDTVSVCAGGGDGTLAAAVTFASMAEWPTQPTLADVDLDGRLDLSLIFDDPDTNPDLVAIHLGLGDGTFAPPLTQPTLGERPRDLAVSDLSGDGLPELVTANTKGKSVTVMISGGGATFPTKHVYPNEESVTGFVAIGDVDGDAVPDVAVAKPGSVALGFRHGHGNGWLGDEQTWSVPAGSSSPLVADIDGDGNPDLGLRGSESLLALTGDGAGDMAEAEVFSLGTIWVQAVVAVDLDHDGLDDLAYAGPYGLWVAHALGDGAFAPASVYFAGTVLRRLAVADVDANGFEDVAGFGTPHSVLLLNHGAMGLAEGPPLPAPVGSGYSTHGRFGDFDADGAPDLAETWWYDSEVTVLRGDGTGSFQLAASVDPSGPPDRFVEVGDYDGDGLDDLAVADGGPPAVLRILAGDGSFGFSLVFDEVICAAVDVADGRLDADAVEDVVVVTTCASLDAGAAGNVLVVRGAADRRFALTPVANTLSAVTEAVLEDIDLDGSQDLVCNAKSKIAVLAGDAQGGFGVPHFFGLSPQSWAIGVGDFDADGFPDLVQAGIHTWGADFPKNARLLRNRHP